MIRNIVFGIGVILLVAVITLTPQVIVHSKYTDGDKEEVRNYIEPRIKVLKILTIILVVLGIFVTVYNAIWKNGIFFILFHIKY